MAFDPDHLRQLRFPTLAHNYAPRDCILYALGIGYGDDPLDGAQLAFLYEEDLKVAPTFASMIAYPGFWYRDLDTGLDATRVVHLGEEIELHAPLPPAGRMVAEGGVVGVEDLGAARGALVISRRVIRDEADGRALATVTQTALARGDGGFDGPEGSPSRRARRAFVLPDRAPDHAMMLATSPRAALIFRLSRDINPLHIDPVAARDAGFPRPILHGLATYGAAGRALVATACGGRPERLLRLDAQFTAPVFPGDTLQVEIWVEGTEGKFRALVDGRVVIDRGWAELGP